MWKCKKCNEYRFSSAKNCHCKSFIVIDSSGDEHNIQAMTDEGAALKFAEQYNEDGDYPLMNSSMEITVHGKNFTISAEPDIYYSAEES